MAQNKPPSRIRDRIVTGGGGGAGVRRAGEEDVAASPCGKKPSPTSDVRRTLDTRLSSYGERR
ncbi:hypothetical protein GCM10018773_52810 [Streptomyces candidus]|nr:hypothetical protein GCM10018773_52810 [Streptomyces candidus]